MKNGQGSIKVYATLLASVVSFFLFATYIFAAASQPQGPTSLTVDSSGRYQNNSNPITVQAFAGNVTGLTIASTRVTESWQGYFGNISGTITLDDANNFTFYDWSLPSPSGEVYASNGSSVTWSNVYCMNVSANGTSPVMGSGAVGNINGTQIELNYGVNITDRDGLTETFNDTYVNAVGFRTGSVVIDTSDGCSMAHPYS
ncbi:MAG TPA: hypothetical protein VI564_02950, partial [Candidatus Nanoarchaeia archaeon]|nr:hypothetical protein [Candidatus Nanoarchaeia archaeon]